MSLRVLIAPDKFKGTLTAWEAATAIAKGWRRARPGDKLELLPISDGGDGFGAVMNELLAAQPRTITTVDAAHRRCRASWWWHPSSRTAIIESARVVGLAMLPQGCFHPFELDTFGLGRVLLAATQQGARQIILGIGGSATNDGGFGLARALGWSFRDRRAGEITNWTGLHRLVEIVPPANGRMPKIIVAVDVQNQLLGKLGASRVYGPQKGLRQRELPLAEKNLARLAMAVGAHSGKPIASWPGAGAAGGLGFGLAAFAGAKLAPGFALFAQRAGLKQRVRAADLVITGEGSIDDSTGMGKGVGELAALCRGYGVPCVGLAGRALHSPSVLKLFQSVAGLTDFAPVAAALREPARHLARLAERGADRWAMLS